MKNLATGLILVTATVLTASLIFGSEKKTAIDRRALVKRHNPVFHKADPLLPLSVGNGEFAFTPDVTGLQTFDQFHEAGIPLATQSQWGWHTLPNPAGYSVEDFPLTYYESHGRRVGYLYSRLKGRWPEMRWLRANPHKLHLGRVGFELRTADGDPVEIDQLKNIEQTLDLYSGIISSYFELGGHPVRVRTSCHPTIDLIAVHVESDLMKNRQLKVAFHFPYGVADLDRAFQPWSKKTADWTRPECHETTMRRKANRLNFDRQLDNDRYYVAAMCSSIGKVSRLGRHKVVVTPSMGSGVFEFVCAFAPEPIPDPLPTVPETEDASRRHWERFWWEGGAVELAGSKDPRAHELERRLVLSHYLIAIQCAGSLPPQESGLTHNSWSGKLHTEMHWWYAAQFALWGRIHLLERSLPFYFEHLPRAQARARSQGYSGARWMKCTGPEGIQVPGYVEHFLVWQQPHPIYYAELCYRTHGNRETLEKYREVVFQTAEFMASFAAWDEAAGRYVLGPPVIPMSEFYLEKTAIGENPSYGLAYWDFGLEVAQKWRQRLGLPREAKWDHIREHLSRLPVKDGLYVELESVPESFTLCRGHPSFVAPLGVLPGNMVNRETMRRTLFKLMETWDWDTTWGMDFSMLAMTAARLGECELAIDILMKHACGNRWLPNGHVYAFEDLPAQLSGNGGLLMAIAMMAAGWDGAPERNAPGFPSDGSWTVRCEGLRPMP